MAYQVRTTKTAEAQIELAYRWFRTRDPDYADQWFRGLMDAIATLQEKPLRCSLARESSILLEELRQFCMVKAGTAIECCFLFGVMLYMFSMCGMWLKKT